MFETFQVGLQYQAHCQLHCSVYGPPFARIRRQ